MTLYSLGERLLLLKCMVVRRVPSARRIESQLLMEALQADHELVRNKSPHLYFNAWDSYIGQEVEDCVELELLDNGVKLVRGKPVLPTTSGYTRTKLGCIFLETLEPRLLDALDQMPMSNIGVLDFLGLM